MLVDVDAMGSLARERDGTIVVVSAAPALGDSEPLESIWTTMRSLVRQTSASTPIVLLADSKQLESIDGDNVLGDVDRELFVLAQRAGSTRTQALADVLVAASPSDVALVVSGVLVAAEWLPMLRSAAMSDTTVASATPLSLGRGAVELALSDGWAADPRGPGVSADESIGPGCERRFEEVAAQLADRFLRVQPRLATIGPCCGYIRRAALEIVGTLDGRLGLEQALADLAMRATAAGMVHIGADRVLIDGRGLSAHTEQPAVSWTSGLAERAEEVRETIECDDRSPLRRSLAVARRPFESVSVTIDGRALVSAYGGTQTYLLGLITALARARRTAIRVLTPPDLSERAQHSLEELDGVELVAYEQMVAGAPATAVVHRPQQVFTADDLSLLRLAGGRLVVGQQDLIAYHNWSYHQDLDRWKAYRRVTRLALAVADQVVFFSEHARRDALAEDLVREERAHVIGIGPSAEPESEERPPDGVDANEPFLLCLGADYAHKNRPFAIELQRALRGLGWLGRLVFAGAHVEHGSSAERERELLDGDDELRAHVTDVGSVDELQRRWLLRRARALVYPTLYEGFGLIPAEAAAWGAPCLFAPNTSLAELSTAAATLVAWDPQASAVATIALLEDGEERRAHLAVLSSLPSPSWEIIADQLAAVYERAVSCPPSAAAPSGWQEIERERVIATLERQKNELGAVAQEYQDAYHRFERRVAHGLPLIDEGGLLSRAQQRGLMRVAARRGVGGLLLSPLGLLGRDDARG